MTRILICAAGLGVALSATTVAGQTATALKAPASLTAVSATRSAVSLSWSAGDATMKFVVERKALGAPWPAASAAPATAADSNRPLSPSAIATVDAATATDAKIDQFATYVYRVRAVGGANALSAPSNEIIVGPPPVGFTSIVAAPKAMHEHDPNQFGALTRVILDANGDPAVAYLTVDVNNDGEPLDSELAFIAWNRARYRWNAAVYVDTVGDVPNSGARLAFSLARDESNGRLGLAYAMGGAHELKLATSDDQGATWKSVTVLRTPVEEGGIATPSVLLSGGRVHLAYFVGNVGVRYQTGAQSETADKWPASTAPLLAGTAESRSEGVAVILDPAGKPAVTYWLNPAENYTLTAALWHPGGAAVKIGDTDGHQTDDPALSVAVSGGQIAVGLYANRDDKFFDNHHLWFTKSLDNGATWSPIVAVADDGGNVMGPPFNVTLDRAGHAAMVSNVAGGNSDGTKCGQPKLARAGDNGAWTTCAPETRGADRDADVFGPNVVFAGNDKLYVVFKTRGGIPGIAPGLTLWRER